MIPVVLALAVLLAFGVYARPRELAHALRDFEFVYLIPIVSLALANYGIRFVRWQYFLRVVEIHVETRRSAGIFLSGLALSVTPGKLGELFKCLMLKRELGSPYSRTVPVVVDERLTDLLAVVLLAGLGIARYPAGRVVFVAGVVTVIAITVTLALSPRFADRLGPWLARRLAREAAADSAEETACTFGRLLGIVMTGCAWCRSSLAGWETPERPFESRLPVWPISDSALSTTSRSSMRP